MMSEHSAGGPLDGLPRAVVERAREAARAASNSLVDLDDVEPVADAVVAALRTAGYLASPWFPDFIIENAHHRQSGHRVFRFGDEYLVFLGHDRASIKGEARLIMSQYYDGGAIEVTPARWAWLDRDKCAIHDGLYMWHCEVCQSGWTFHHEEANGTFPITLLKITPARIKGNESVAPRPVDPAAETLGLRNVHPPEVCAGEVCCVHNPSDHHMREWRTLWRSDRQLLERLCPEHGVGHPDPDHLAYVRRTRSKDDAWAEGIHGCCGCCRAVTT